MRILLLGGTGAMGIHLSKIISDRGDNIVITSRSSKESTKQIEYREGDAKDLDFLNNILEEKWDTIVDFMVYSQVDFKERIEKLLSRTSQYIFLSSSRVYDNSKEFITEDTTKLVDTTTDKEYLQTDEYALSKARQEDILKSSNKQNWTIIRPYITYSEIRLQLGTLEKENWLYRAIHGRTIIFSEDIKNHFTTLTYGLDVSTAMSKFIGNSSCLGESYHITNDTSYKWDDLLNVYLDVLEEKLGSRPKVLYQNLSDYSSWNPGKYQIIYDRLFDRKFDNTKINQFMDTSDFIDARKGIEQCLKSFLENPKFSAISWRQEAIKDKITKEATPLSELTGLKSKIKYVLFRYIF
jgi:nucleoside-diphosphate-sugar epimerase